MRLSEKDRNVNKKEEKDTTDAVETEQAEFEKRYTRAS